MARSLYVARSLKMVKGVKILIPPCKCSSVAQIIKPETDIGVQDEDQKSKSTNHWRDPLFLPNLQTKG